jgi:hypothetical protein
MDGEQSGGLLGWVVDGFAAACAAGALAFSAMVMGHPLAGLLGGAGLLLLSFTALRAINPAVRYRLPALDLPEWDEVLAFAETFLPAAAPELVATNGNVVRLHAGRSLPTPGELKRRIDAHLAEPRPADEDDDNVVLLAPDASAALRAALAELRRALN